MRALQAPQAEFSRIFAARLLLRFPARGAVWLSLALFSLIVPQSLLARPVVATQASPVTATSPAPAHKKLPAHRSSPRARPAAQPASQQAASPPAPAVPKAPDWPANELPSPASVVWDSHGLLVVASNSSLTQILKEISLETGIQVEGMSQDQRVFGTYGPATPRDVLSQLLDGSGYDVLMIGDQGKGIPRQVVLTVSPGGPPPASNANPGPSRQEETSAAEEAQPEEIPPPQAQPPPNSFAPAVPLRTQQQLMEEMQERERELEQQRQQEQQQQGPQ